MSLRIPFVHVWRPMKWGGGRLDCRECRICGRFELYAYWSWHKYDRSKIPDAKPAGVTPEKPGVAA